LGERLATSGSSRSVEVIIAKFIATVMNATGGEKPALTRTLPHEVCGYNLILRVRGSASVLVMRPIFWRIVKRFRVRDVVERVAEFFPRRHIGLAKPGKVRRDNMKPVREKRDQVQEHVARAREAVQEQQLRRIGISCLT